MANLVRISIQGTMPGGEAWSINPVWGFDAPGPTLGNSECGALAAALNGVTIPATLKSFNVAAVKQTGYRVEARAWDGTLEGVGEFAFTATTDGTGSTGIQSYQNSMVLSLSTLNAGARGKGRVYWPITAIPLTAGTLRASTGDVSNFLTAMKSYLTGIQTIVRSSTSQPTARLIVWSRVNEAGYGVVSLRAGDIMDVQRRRRDSLVENYTSTTFP